jgi:hypothetical protein
MGRGETRERVASELFATVLREGSLLRIDRGPDGRGESVEFKEKTIEAIAEACVRAADKLVHALDREPAA